jgi:2-polyprenyl-3-methyl-5-hydroxy-6-metoxy-1,4-benzoquinol methylase
MDTTPATSHRASTDDWDAHWNQYSATNALNPAQIYRHRLIFELLALRDGTSEAPRQPGRNQAGSPLRLLDLGSGSGEFASQVLLARKDAEVVGLDLAESGVAMARKKVPAAKFFQQDFTKPMQLEERYKGWATLAVCSEVLEHLDDPGAMLKNIRPYLAPGCRVIITVPAGPMSAFDKHIGHRRHFSPELLESTLRGAGLEVEDLWGAGFPFFNLYRLVVVARGKALIKDAAGETGESKDGAAKLPLAARAMIRMFSLLFKMNADKTRLGWQLAAVGVVPKP